MKGLVCRVCGFIAIDGTAPEKCPVCHAPQTAFAEKDEAIKTPGGTVQGEPEKKHIPYVSVTKKCGLVPEGCTDVNVKIGEITHPMMPGHHIAWIDFYIDRKFVSRITFTPGQVNPAAGLHLKVDSGKFAAIETCNLHGSWMKEVDL
jgi:superoxide reductase